MLISLGFRPSMSLRPIVSSQATCESRRHSSASLHAGVVAASWSMRTSGPSLHVARTPCSERRRTGHMRGRGRAARARLRPHTDLTSVLSVGHGRAMSRALALSAAAGPSRPATRREAPRGATEALLPTTSMASGGACAFLP